MRFAQFQDIRFVLEIRKVAHDTIRIFTMFGIKQSMTYFMNYHLHKVLTFYSIVRYDGLQYPRGVSPIIP